MGYRVDEEQPSSALVVEMGGELRPGHPRSPGEGELWYVGSRDDARSSSRVTP